MTDTIPSLGSTKSDICYEDYLCAICSLDAEWSREGLVPVRDAFLPFRFALDQFTTLCWTYGRRVAENHGRFLESRPRPRTPDHSAAAQMSEPLATYLFNPACYWPFGHADAFAFLLLDDWDPVHHITAASANPIEDATIGLCPKVESLGVPIGRELFCGLHEILDASPAGHVGASAASICGSFRPASLAAHADMPLLLFTRLKLDGLGTVGPGLLFQQAVLRACAQEITRVHGLLMRLADEGDPAVGALMTRPQVSATRCAFMDLFGSTELGLLIFCTNFSVAASLVAAMRAVTYRHLFQVDDAVGGKLRTCLDRSIVHRQIVAHACRRLGQDRRAARTSEQIEHNHVFRWTNSVASIAWDTFLPPERLREGGESAAAVPETRAVSAGRLDNCGGYVRARSDFLLAPGHRIDAERKAAVAAARVEPHLRTMDRSRYREYLIGAGDLPVYHGYEWELADGASASQCSPPSLLPLKDVVELTRQYLVEFGFENVENFTGRDATDFATSLSVPVPRVAGVDRDGRTVDLICGQKDPLAHFPSLGIVLRETRERLCRYSQFEDPKPPDLGPRPGGLDLGRLRRAPRTYGVPMSLRRTIEYLFQDFATFIADPFAFDNVLDLYDCFATLHRMLVTEFPQLFGASAVAGGRPHPHMLDEESVSRLSRLVAAMHNALEHRTAGTYPEVRLRDTAVDFRGGIQQILFAADAPLKCGLGLLRRFVLQGNDPQHRDTVGALTQIQFAPGAKIHDLTISSKSARFGFLSGDVAHVLHVASYSEYLHETFHLIFHELRRQKTLKGGWPLPASLRDTVMDERLNEVFVIFLSQIFLFGRDVETFRRHSLITYAQSVASMGAGDRDIAMRSVEFLIRLFLGTHMAESMPEHDPLVLWPAEYPRNHRDRPEVALQSFRRMVNEHAWLLPDYERLWQGPNASAVRRFCDAQFRDIYGMARGFLPKLWQEALRLHRCYSRTAFLSETASAAQESASSSPTPAQVAEYEAKLDHLNNVVQEAMREGRAVLRMACPAEYQTGEDQALDPMSLICAMLRAYIGEIANATGKDIHLPRDPTSRDICFGQNRNWHEFLIDRGSPAMFCPVPTARRARLRRHIAIVKTFWDISSGLRARRLAEIIRDNWQEPGTLPGSPPGRATAQGSS